MHSFTFARSLVAFVATVVLGGEVWGQLVTFDTSGTNQSGSLAATFNATQQDSGVSGTPQLTRTTLTATGAGASGSFYSLNANTGALNLSTNYVGFQVTPAAGQALIARNINWMSQGNNTSPNSYATAYSTDAFATSIQTLFSGTTSTTAQSRSFDITDLITNDTLSVRLYNYGATSINGGSSASTGPFRVISPTVVGSTVTAATGNISLVENTEIRNSTALTLGGVISGNFSVTKTSAGALTLTNSNTYSGNTTVSAGTLQLSGSGSINSSPTITVGSGATFDVATVTGGYSVAANQTLRGQGTVTGAVKVAANGTIRGSDTNNGDLTLNGGLTMLANSTVAVGISGGNASGTAGGSSSGSANNTLLDITGGTTTINAGTRFSIDGTGVSFTNFSNYSYIIATGAGNKATLNITDQALFSTTGFSAQAFSVTGDVSGNIYLNFQPVPEPATVLAIGAAGLGVVSWVRRRRQKATAATVTAE